MTWFERITTELPLKPNQVTSFHVFPFILSPPALAQGFATLGSLPIPCTDLFFHLSPLFMCLLSQQTNTSKQNMSIPNQKLIQNKKSET